MEDKKLFLLDAYALIYRAYYALIRAPRITSKGFNTSAIFGFCNTLHEVLTKENPTHIAVCFDPSGPTFRHEMFGEYKANREKQPEDITLSVPIIKEIIQAYDIPIFEIPGYEADDVIGTLATQAAAEGFTAYMMTPDKDFGQLVTDRILQYRPSLRGQDFEIRGPREVCERYGIENTRQVIDLLALEGDSIDNIPGCPGVGQKTAVKLINEYGSVENMLGHADEIKGALGNKIRTNERQILFSKDLATIRTDVPVTADFNALRRGPVNVEALAEIYRRLEFKMFLSRLKGVQASKPQGAKAPVAEAKAVPAQPSLFDFIESDAADQTSEVEAFDASKTEYKAISEPDEIKRLVEEAIRPGSTVGIVVYAVGEEAMTAPIRAVAVSTADRRARLVRLSADADAHHGVIELLRPLFTSPDILLSSHDIKRDMVLLHREGVEITSPYFDTSLAHYILQPEMRHRLPDIALSVLQYRTSNYEESTTSRKPYGAIAPEAEVNRLGEQADLVRRLVEPLRKLLRENGQLPLFEEVELPMARVLASMEEVGVRVNVMELDRQSKELTARLRDIEQQCYELAGEKFNIGSPMQVGEILFGKMQLDPKAKKTKKGSYSTTEEILEKYRASVPLVDLILRARALKKLLATYIDALPGMVNPATGKIHTTFGQTVTATGRLSSVNPNLQNIPVRTEDGREVRRAFIADPGCIILSADYSQIELRLLANLAHDPELTEAFLSGADIHRSTAAKIYHVPLEEVTSDQRRKAKTANFGTVYGISAFGLSERLSIPRSEAKELIEGYFRTYPHIRQYIDRAVEEARKDGYVTTVLGRKRYLPDINSRNATVRNFAERNAVNAPLQGSAADVIKVAMINIYNEMVARGMRSQMIMQVHDELIFNVVPDELPALQELVTRLMSDAPNLASGFPVPHFDVPLEVSSGTGENWLEAH